jgi:hypothetical protein
MSAVDMVARQLDKRGEDAQFHRFIGPTGNRTTGGSAAPTYASAVTVRAMPWSAKEQDAGGGSERGTRVIVGAAELLAAAVTEIRGPDKIVLGGVDYQVSEAEAIRQAGVTLYFDCATEVR